jgi:hypothetical protein
VVVGAVRYLRGSRAGLPGLEFDTFSVALGLAVVTGGVSLAVPYLVALTGALVALAGAGWAAGRSRWRNGWRDLGQPARCTGLLLVGAGVVAFFDLPGTLSVARGLALALSTVPLWLVERRDGRILSERRGATP